MSLVMGIFWSAWTVYLCAMSIRNHREKRIGYFLSACVCGYTAYLLMN